MPWRVSSLSLRRSVSILYPSIFSSEFVISLFVQVSHIKMMSGVWLTATARSSSILLRMLLAFV
jgi:hypothetical protein